MSPCLVWLTKAPEDGGPKLHRNVVTYIKPFKPTYATIQVYILDTIKQMNKDWM